MAEPRTISSKDNPLLVRPLTSAGSTDRLTPDNPAKRVNAALRLPAGTW